MTAVLVGRNEKRVKVSLVGVDMRIGPILKDGGEGSKVQPQILLGNDVLMHITRDNILWTELGEAPLSIVLKPDQRQNDDMEEGRCGNHLEDDEVAAQKFSEGLEWVEGRSEVRLPWRKDRQLVSDTYGMALGRLRGFVKRYGMVGVVFNEYSRQMAGLERDGIVEQAPRQENGTPFYLPHRAVWTADGRKVTNKTERFCNASMRRKCRIVFDAGASNKIGISLNDALHRGPVLMWKIATLMIRLRLAPVQVIADIEKAYLQIGIRPSDRDALRFLWFFKPEEGFEKSSSNIRVMRFTRCPFGIKCGSFLLAAVIQEVCLNQKGTALEEVAERVMRDLYADNIQHGASSVDDAVNFKLGAKDLFAGVGMKLKGWISNNPEFNDQLEQKERADQEVQSLLGVLWDTTVDELAIKSPLTAEIKDSYTKKEMLSVLNGMYDPNGFLLPLIIKARLHYGKVCLYAKTWNAVLSSPDAKLWKIIVEDLMEADIIPVPRHIGSSVGGCDHVAVFCDASEDAVAAVGYIIVKKLMESGKYRWMANLVLAKASTSKGGATIPRRELSAIQLGSRIIRQIRCATNTAPSECSIWSDSSVAVQQVHHQRNKESFVRNRVQLIRKSLPGVSMGWVSSDLNPADLPSRGVPIKRLIRSEKPHLWWEGPPFLKQERTEWPTRYRFIIKDDDTAEADSSEEPTEEDPDINESACAIGQATGTKTWRIGAAIATVLDLNTFNSFRKLLLRTSFILAFTKTGRLMTKLQRIEEAENVWIRQQQDTFLTSKMRKQENLSEDKEGICRENHH
eukprot:GHVS01013608.1.p1 GENE.GHVS01013608.1~~GHVS01013608.1.p1  ORF type:complete len:842 (+),score=65.07 GHVS01013608.1:146-2527(+)